MSYAATVGILLAIILTLAAIASWAARKALAMNALAHSLKRELHEAWGIASHWQIECGIATVDAEKWRLARDARRRNRTQAQRQTVLAMAERLREGR